MIKNPIYLLRAILPAVFILILLVGEIKCIYKAVKCNWEPIGKAEIIYTGAALCGLGVFVGWIEIEDD
jgi:hypothetical protein